MAICIYIVWTIVYVVVYVLIDFWYGGIVNVLIFMYSISMLWPNDFAHKLSQSRENSAEFVNAAHNCVGLLLLFRSFVRWFNSDTQNYAQAIWQEYSSNRQNDKINWALNLFVNFPNTIYTLNHMLRNWTKFEVRNYARENETERAVENRAYTKRREKE